MPPSQNTEVQPYFEMNCAAMSPPSAEPSEKPMNISMTIVARLRCGLYSEVSAIEFGMAPPRPRPVNRRHQNRLSSEVGGHRQQRADAEP